MPPSLHTFADFIVKTKHSDIPREAIDAAKLILADSIAAMIGGMAEAEMQDFAKAMSDQSNGSHNGRYDRGHPSIYGLSRQADCATASLVNGAAGTVLEMDEGHQFAKGHPGMHVLPALLALTEQHSKNGKKISGQDFLRAFILGYDIAARTGLATQLNSTMHPHGTWGGIGAAAGLAALENLAAKDVINLINIASSLTLATSRKTMLEGGTVRNIYAGVSNQMAHLSLTLLRAGFSGEEDGISSVFGGVVSPKFDWDLACEDLGKRFEVCRNYFKLHACCRYNHAALDALWILMSRHPSLERINAIRQIKVESYHLAAELSDAKPRNVLASKFSIPFAMATTLYHRSSDVLSFTEDARQNGDIIALAQKVSVVEDPQMSAQLPNLRPARVTITMTDGTTLDAAVQTNRGDWQDPYQADELNKKYLSLTARLWSHQKAKQVHDLVMTLDQHGDMAALFDAMAG